MATVEQHAKTMLDNIPEKTGKPLEQWLSLIDQQKLDKHGKIVSFLKSEWQVTHGFASLIAHEFLGQQTSTKQQDNEPDLIALQYSKGKEGLFPIYQEVMRKLEVFGSGLEVSPKKAYVSLRHKKQFALIQPSTKTRVDIGINLKDAEFTERFEVSGSFNAMVSHRVRITDISQIDDELLAFIRKAFDAAG